MRFTGEPYMRATQVQMCEEILRKQQKNGISLSKMCWWMIMSPTCSLLLNCVNTFMWDVMLTPWFPSELSGWQFSRLLGMLRWFTTFFHHSINATQQLEEKQMLLCLLPHKLINSGASTIILSSNRSYSEFDSNWYVWYQEIPGPKFDTVMYI